MTTKTWSDGTGDWNTASDWNPAGVPGPGDDAVIPSGTVSLTTPVTVGSISLTTSSATLGIDGSGLTDTVTGGFNNSGTVNFDTASSGGTLTLGGTLTNSSLGIFRIGNTNLSAGSTVTAAGFSSSGHLDIEGSTSAQATLDIMGPAPATLTGAVNLIQSALLEFASGSITAIGNGAALNIQGTQAHLAIQGNTGSNSALTQLSSNAGFLSLVLGASVITDAGVDFASSGTVQLIGGALTLGGALTNNGDFVVQADPSLGVASVTAASFSNGGIFDV